MDRDTLCGGGAEFEEMLPNPVCDSNWETDWIPSFAGMTIPVFARMTEPACAELAGLVTAKWPFDRAENAGWKWSQESTGRRVRR